MLFTEIAGAPFHYPSAPMSPPSAFWSTGEAPSNYSQKSRYCIMKIYSSVINTLYYGADYSTGEVLTSSQIINHNLDCWLDKNSGGGGGGEESLDWIMFGNNLGM